MSFFEELLDRTERLAILLRDPRPGLSSWAQAYASLMSEIAGMATDVAMAGRVCKLEGIKTNLESALAHWRRQADRDAGEIARLQSQMVAARRLVGSMEREPSGSTGHVSLKGAVRSADLDAMGWFSV